VAKAGKKKNKKDRRTLRARKRKPFLDDITYIDYKDIRLLRKFMTDRGKITPRRITGATAKQQRMVATAVKRARIIALVPFVKEYYR
jgi:small subunit ribosomal protein S18